MPGLYPDIQEAVEIFPPGENLLYKEHLLNFFLLSNAIYYRCDQTYWKTLIGLVTLPTGISQLSRGKLKFTFAFVSTLPPALSLDSSTSCVEWLSSI